MVHPIWLRQWIRQWFVAYVAQANSRTNDDAWAHSSEILSET